MCNRVRWKAGSLPRLRELGRGRIGYDYFDVEGASVEIFRIMKAEIRPMFHAVHLR